MTQTKTAKSVLRGILIDAALAAEQWEKKLSLSSFPNYGEWEDLKDHAALCGWHWADWDELNNSVNEWRYLSLVAGDCEEVEVECKRLAQALGSIEAFIDTVGDYTDSFCR